MLTGKLCVGNRYVRAKDHKTYAMGTVLIVTMFAVWGICHRLYDTILPAFISALSLTHFQVSLAYCVTLLAYCLVAIPSAFFLRNFGYKAGVVGGLGCFAVAMFMFFPAETQHSYLFFLCAGLLANCGVALLEIAADPWIMRLGSADTAIRRLNIAQTFNPLGLLIGIFLGERLISSTTFQSAQMPFLPYILVGASLLLFAYLIDRVKFSPEATKRVSKDDRTIDDLKRVLAMSEFRLGVGALALYIVGHTVLWGFAERYAQSVMPATSGAAVADIGLWTLYAFVIGRFVGTGLMYRFRPENLLIVFSAASVALTAAAALARGWPGIWCIVGASFFMSILFPTIFGLAVKNVGKSMKSASALLIMAGGTATASLAIMNLICGSAFFPYVVLLPSLCFLLVTAFAVMHRKTPAEISPQIATVPS